MSAGLAFSVCCLSVEEGAMSDVTVKLESATDPGAWDGLAARLGGTFFHCHASITYNAARVGAAPLFVIATDAEDRCIGAAGGWVSASTLWPFSRYCRHAEFASLPAAADAMTIQAVLAGTEGALRRQGVCSVSVASYDSAHSASVLGSLGYDLLPRSEFYIDLTKDLDTIWSEFGSKRRRCVRRAGEQGVVTRCENTREAVEWVFRLHEASMERRGVDHDASQERIDLVCTHLLDAGVVDVLITSVDGTPVCAKLVGCFGGHACGLVSGVSDQGHDCFAAIEQVWAQVRRYKEQGMTVLSLGGAKVDEEGLYEFKRQFGTTIVDEPAGRKTLSRGGMWLDRLRSLVRKVGK
jgi:hypothetical protein